jgi:membrane-associated protease RseP (regulator of RpoE activity)
MGARMNQGSRWQFQLFHFPVRVHFSFFLIALLMGVYFYRGVDILLWVLVVFFSLLLHELGHAIVADYHGRSPQIDLYMMGGLTTSTRYSLLSYPKEILISFSGPLAGFLFGGLVLALVSLAGPITSPILASLASMLIWVNIGWGIVNLFPILPLDGGNIMRNLYHWLRSPYDERTPLKISIGFGIFAVVLALVIFGQGGLYLALLAGWLTYNNYAALRRGYWPDRTY